MTAATEKPPAKEPKLRAVPQPPAAGADTKPDESEAPDTKFDDGDPPGGSKAREYVLTEAQMAHLRECVIAAIAKAAEFDCIDEVGSWLANICMVLTEIT